MNRKLILLSLLFILFQNETKSQSTCLSSDTIVFNNLINQNNISVNKTISLNSNGLELDLNKKNALKIAHIILKSEFQKNEMKFQRPFRIYKYYNLWIIIGKGRKHYRGGNIFIIINSKNGAIELLYKER